MTARFGRAVPIALVTLLSGMGAAEAATAADSVRLTFAVEVPSSTPPAAAIWIAGDLPELGGWSGAGLRLRALGGRRFSGAVTVASGTSLAFKVTRGGWETVEKDASGGEIANREWLAVGDDTVRVRVAAWRDQSEGEVARPHTLAGDIRSHPAMGSRFVRSRDVLVYLPPGYDADTRLRYPVLYFHDGNNVFDAATSFIGVEWGVDETAERLIRDGRVRPFIAVVIANTPDRVDEYTPTADAGRGGGRAAAYASFLVEELKPFIDAHYRTAPGPEHTGVIGSSLGGIVSVYLALEHPRVFGLVGCLSPAAWWAGNDIVRRVAAGRGATGRFWVDIGTREGRGAEGLSEALGSARALRDALRARGYREGADLHYEEVAGAVHDERAWAARVDRVITFLLGPPGASAIGPAASAATSKRAAPPISLATLHVDSFEIVKVDSLNDSIAAGARAGERWTKDPVRVALEVSGASAQGSRSLDLRYDGNRGELPDSADVTLVSDGYLDDSVRGSWVWLRLARQRDDTWRVVELRRAWRCWRGHHQGSYSNQPCL